VSSSSNGRGSRATRQRRLVVILLEDHIGDPVGSLLFNLANFDNDAIIERLREYLDPRLKIMRADLTTARAEVEVEVRTLESESRHLTTIAKELIAKGARRNATALYEDALRLDPLNSDAAMGFGLLLADLKKYDEALRLLKRAREYGPDRADLLHSLGRVSMLADRRASAIAYFERAYELEPGNSAVRRALAEAGRIPPPRTHLTTPSPESKRKN
jgi:tetratricopeptide (TPR) repeat protein